MKSGLLTFSPFGLRRHPNGEEKEEDIIPPPTKAGGKPKLSSLLAGCRGMWGARLGRYSTNIISLSIFSLYYLYNIMYLYSFLKVVFRWNTYLCDIGVLQISYRYAIFSIHIYDV